MMNPRFLTTGQAAEFCSVTPDTIRKWIYSGWLRARRTPGGHHRIDERDLEQVLGRIPSSTEELLPANQPGQFRYCWEYKNQGNLAEGCRECVVYQMRAHRCYEVAKLAPELGHSMLYCKGSCEDCDYYRRVHKQDTNVMVVTADPNLKTLLESEKHLAPYNLEITDCEYSCSALVDRFRADYVVVDTSLGPERANDICAHVLEDPRLPYVKVVLALDAREYPDDCDKNVFARIEKPFLISDITRCLDATQNPIEGDVRAEA